MFGWIHAGDWSWYQIVFLGAFFSVVGVLFTSVATAVLKTRRDIASQRVDAIQWHSAFEDLPLSSRVCRHELTGEIRHRTCNHGFDCRTCVVHPSFAAGAAFRNAPAAGEAHVYGMTLPLTRMYHRGHAWVRKEGDETFVVGLDDFAQTLLGNPEGVDLPDVGTHLHANGTGWYVMKDGMRIRILSPIDGLVVARGGPESGWLLRVKPDAAEEVPRHLLRGTEIAPWIAREVERLQLALETDGAGMCLADGGELIPDLRGHYPQADWDSLLAAIFLEP